MTKGTPGRITGREFCEKWGRRPQHQTSPSCHLHPCQQPAENDVSSVNTPAWASSRRIISGTAERTNSARRTGRKHAWSQGCKSWSRSTSRSSGRDRSPSGVRPMVRIRCWTCPWPLWDLDAPNRDGTMNVAAGRKPADKTSIRAPSCRWASISRRTTGCSKPKSERFSSSLAFSRFGRKSLRGFAVQGDFVKRRPAGLNRPAGLLYAGLDIAEQPLHALAAVVELLVVVQPEAVEVLEQLENDLPGRPGVLQGDFQFLPGPPQRRVVQGVLVQLVVGKPLGKLAEDLLPQGLRSLGRVHRPCPGPCRSPAASLPASGRCGPRWCRPRRGCRPGPCAAGRNGGCARSAAPRPSGSRAGRG